MSISSTYTAQHFEEVSQSEEYLLQTIEQLVNILSSDELNVKSEEDVFKAAMDWISYDLDKRRQYLENVLKHVRFPLMSPKFLVGTVDRNTFFSTPLTLKRLYNCLYSVTPAVFLFVPSCVDSLYLHMHQKQGKYIKIYQ